MPKYEKGILGVRKDPKNQILFSFNVREGEEWPSDDSDDSDYDPGKSLELLSKSKENSSSDEAKSVQDTAKKYKSVETPSKRQKRDDSNKDDSVRNAKKKNAAKCETVSSSIKSTTNIHLPPEIWMTIFRFVVEVDGAVPFLPRASRVCRSWNELTSEPSLWKKVDLSYGWAKVDEKHMDWLCKNRFSETKDLNLSLCKEVNGKILKMISQNCPNLRSINLSYCKKCPSKTLTILAEGCKLLEDVDVSFTNKDVVSHIPLRGFISTQGPYLKRLTLGGNKFVGLNLVLNDLMEKCPNLELLDISNALFSNNSMDFNIEKLQVGCRKLEILRLANSPFRASPCTLREMAQCDGFLHLKELSIACSSSGTVSTSVGINTTFIYRILRRCYNLKLLDMRGISEYTCILTLIELPINGLERLYLSNSAVARCDRLQDIIRKWKHSLLEVDLSWNSFQGEILDLGLYAFTQGKDPSPLQRLNIAGTPVNLLPLQAILKLCKDLHYLNLTSCRAIPRGFKREYRNRQEIDKLQEDILNCSDSTQND
ncbi:hypothetical protein CHS0354_040469 [Potamilus streckersoni]|uniref:F-box domain-containing protein n=1 Tax=Potamilus streckersoni TaxID=2493646 RepID=A0AAE0TK97_9BIVA|nr:hypothetical protein CHS0354_040469 [Potamilus streckersoni]